MDFIPLVWLIAGLLLLGAEMFIPGFVIFFFGAGALLVSLLTWLIPGLKENLLLQFIIWLVSSGLTLGFFRKFFSKIFRGKEQRDTGEDEFVCKQATVIEPIENNKAGRVSFEGTSWKAIAYDENIRVGDTVEILKKDNLTLIVTRVGGNGEPEKLPYKEE
ncbi:MAG: NfeD family protein [Spirochaetales bacterium]|nr:NfeD family protein [Spirochaetales bacterium]